ncbi:hypothetical protein [Sphingobium naphthae]|uniref:Uncharacterized protein n=1 Tax=Sphingobium naphthae TaxID=1886786 RepID=A0ABU3ZT90_9SPHN|nr:hypothetical protein [Sphingobium naphthae]MDV5822717.1 hypothetical protein [Sphingobium naphthae]|tara:strand:- start:103 stop:345 length:243 start_codon:yes stop_codon:yes gene_type:complete
MLTTSLLLLAAATAASPQKADPVCQNSKPHKVKQAAEPAAQPMGTLPPADQIKAVLHSENGCEKPVIVRRNVGAKPPAHQ